VHLAIYDWIIVYLVFGTISSSNYPYQVICFLEDQFYFLFDDIYMNSKMVRTREGWSFNSDCVRPTAYVIRRRGSPSTSLPNEDFEDYIEQEKVKIDYEVYLDTNILNCPHLHLIIYLNQFSYSCI